MHRMSVRRGRRGVNLVDVILSISLLALVMIVLFNLFPSALLAVRQAEHRVDATNMAESILEELRASPFSQLTLGSQSAFRSINIDGTDFIADLEIAEVKDSSGVPADPARLKGLTVRVRWNEILANRTRPQSITQELWVCVLKR